ncbi:hypothetical protein MRX96_044058 [Rhipicephalus microplus]
MPPRRQWCPDERSTTARAPKGWPASAAATYTLDEPGRSAAAHPLYRKKRHLLVWLLIMLPSRHAVRGAAVNATARSDAISELPQHHVKTRTHNTTRASKHGRYAVANAWTLQAFLP